MAFLHFIFRFFKKCFRWFSYLLGATALILTLFLFIKPQKQTIADKTVLFLDFDQDFSEHQPQDFFSYLSYGDTLDLQSVLSTIKKASFDNRVTAILGKVSSPSLSVAQIQEIRNALADFKESGKKTYLFSTSFGNLEQGLSGYYLATAFDEIILQPTGELGISGLAIESHYFKNMLNKIGIETEFSARHEYKTGASGFTDEKMSDPERENIQLLLNDMLTTFATDIAVARQLPVDKTQELLTNGPYFSTDALKLKLVDTLAYLHEKKSELTADGSEIIDFTDYFYETEQNVSDKDGIIAYVPLTGLIIEGKSQYGLDAYTSVLGSDDVFDVLDEAMKDNLVKAVVLRIDSPGGAYPPSDAVYHHIDALKKQTGKPVVCSVGSTAASGGYFIALACDKIFAQPLSITGSIGVFGGKFSFKPLLEKIGIVSEINSIGKNAGFLTVSKTMTPSQKEFFEHSLDKVYADFTQKTQEKRHFSEQQIDTLARGRVFTGKQAVANGLIDAVGGIEEAVKKASDMAGYTKTLPVVSYPSALSETEMLLSLFSGKNVTRFPLTELATRFYFIKNLSTSDLRLLYWR